MLLARMWFKCLTIIEPPTYKEYSLGTWIPNQDMAMRQVIETSQILLIVISLKYLYDVFHCLSCGQRRLLLKVILSRSSTGSEMGQSILRSIWFSEIFGASFVIPSWCLFNMSSGRWTAQQIVLHLLLLTILVIRPSGRVMFALGSYGTFCTSTIWIALTWD